jgi:hypothetical protein
VESAFVLALGRLGVAPAAALATGLLYRLAQVAPLVLAGLPLLVSLPRRRERPAAQLQLECARA